jgi:hypothetical protein
VTGQSISGCGSQRSITSPAFRCTIIPSAQQSEKKLVELLQWLLGVAREQKREAAA